MQPAYRFQTPVGERLDAHAYPVRAMLSPRRELLRRRALGVAFHRKLAGRKAGKKPRERAREQSYLVRLEQRGRAAAYVDGVYPPVSECRRGETRLADERGKIGLSRRAPLRRRKEVAIRAARLAERDMSVKFHQSSSPTFRMLTKASLGTSTEPTRRIRFLPSFCFSSSFFLRLISPP